MDSSSSVDLARRPRPRRSCSFLCEILAARRFLLGSAWIDFDPSLHDCLAIRPRLPSTSSHRASEIRLPATRIERVQRGKAGRPMLLIEISLETWMQTFEFDATKMEKQKQNEKEMEMDVSEGAEVVWSPGLTAVQAMEVVAEARAQVESREEASILAQGRVTLLLRRVEGEGDEEGETKEWDAETWKDRWIAGLRETRARSGIETGGKHAALPVQVIRARAAALAQFPGLREAYQRLVESGAVGEDEFWKTQIDVVKDVNQEPEGQKSNTMEKMRGFSNFSVAERLDRMTPAVRNRILERSPIVRQEYENKVKSGLMDEIEFWERQLLHRIEVFRHVIDLASLRDPSQLKEEALRGEVSVSVDLLRNEDIDAAYGYRSEMKRISSAGVETETVNPYSQPSHVDKFAKSRLELLRIINLASSSTFVVSEPDGPVSMEERHERILFGNEVVDQLEGDESRFHELPVQNHKSYFSGSIDSTDVEVNENQNHENINVEPPSASIAGGFSRRVASSGINRVESASVSRHFAISTASPESWKQVLSVFLKAREKSRVSEDDSARKSSFSPSLPTSEEALSAFRRLCISHHEISPTTAKSIARGSSSASAPTNKFPPPSSTSVDDSALTEARRQLTTHFEAAEQVCAALRRCASEKKVELSKVERLCDVLRRLGNDLAALRVALPPGTRSRVEPAITPIETSIRYALVRAEAALQSQPLRPSAVASKSSLTPSVSSVKTSSSSSIPSSLGTPSLSLASNRSRSRGRAMSLATKRTSVFALDDHEEDDPDEQTPTLADDDSPRKRRKVSEE